MSSALPLFDLGTLSEEPYTVAAPPQAPPGLPAARWFVRCTDCLTIAAVTKLPDPTRWTCDAWKGPIESMGKVQRDRLVRESHACPCDDRCTYARGPQCDCKCGGKNHGTRRTVLVIRDAGSVPRIRMPEPIKAQRTALEYRTLRSQALGQLDALNARRCSGEYLPAADFDRLRQLRYALRKAHEARLHGARVRVLTAAIGTTSALR